MPSKMNILRTAVIMVSMFVVPHVARSADSESLLSFGADGKLLCLPDKQGNRIPDFSRSGYMGGGVSLPDFPVREVLEPGKGDADDTLRIQAAIDKVSLRAPDKSGIRGALLLKRGLYRVSGSLKVTASGVVIRGEGQKSDGTILLATGKQNRTLITVGGKTAIKEIKESRRRITDSYVPWGATSFSIESAKGLSVGDPIIIYRPSTAEWIHDIGMDRINSGGKDTKQWTAGGYDLRFERIVTAIKGNRITLDAPVVNAMDEKYGGGYIYRFTESGRWFLNIRMGRRMKTKSMHGQAWRWLMLQTPGFEKLAPCISAMRYRSVDRPSS